MIDTQDIRSLSGKHVVSSDSERIGKVVDVYESTDGGGGTFATVATGLFGTHASFFPLDQATLSGDEVVVPYTKDKVKDAPRVDHDRELSAEEEMQLFAYYGLQAGDSAVYPDEPRVDTAVGHDTSGPTTDSAMTRSEERLHVGTESLETGRARLKKFVVTEMETRTVPVSHEEVRVVSEPITEGNVGASMDGPAISEEEHEVVLHAERPVVAKEAVPVERVSLATETVTEQATVQENLAKERIETDGV